MTGDDLRVIQVKACKFSTLGRHIFMAGTMEAVTTYAIFLVVLIRKSIHVCIRRHCLMERRVEHTHLRDRRKNSRHSLDAKDIGRIMKRRKN